MKNELAHTFAATAAFIGQSVADLSDDEMVLQPAGVRNHAAWTLGHVIYSCQELAAELGTDRWLPDDWESRFGYGSLPLADRGAYPSRTELIALFDDSVTRLREALLAAEDSVLARRLPDDDFPTLGHILMQVVLGHTAYHAGQLAVWRRAIGREPAAVFV